MTDVAAASAQVRASSSGPAHQLWVSRQPCTINCSISQPWGFHQGPSHLSTLLNTSLSPIRHPAYGDFGETDSLMAQTLLGLINQLKPHRLPTFCTEYTASRTRFFLQVREGPCRPLWLLDHSSSSVIRLLTMHSQQQLPWQQLQGQQQQGQTQLQQQAQSNLQQQYMQQQSLQHHQMLQQLQQHEQQGQGQHQMPAAALTQLQQMQHQSRVQALDHERAMMQQQQQHDFELQTARQGQSACNLQHTVSSRQLEVLLQLSGLSSVLQRLQLGASLPRK